MVAGGRAREGASESRLLAVLLPSSVFVSGAVIMVLEVLGTRLIAPVYGTSLAVWSALIAVTLSSLSVGYWLGGRLADRLPSPAVYFAIFEAAALLVVAVRFVREPVLVATLALGLRAGAVAAAALLLAAPLTLLGMLSPFAIRLRTEYLASLGTTAGRLYAISTAGSLLGTLLAGFYLLPLFRISTIFLGCAVALTLPALVYQLTSHRRGLALAAAVLGLVAVSLRTASEGRGAIRHASESHFGQIKVVDSAGTREMLINGARQTLVDLRTGASLATYPTLLAKLAYQMKPDGTSALVMGLGGGALPPLFASWGVRSVVVEIDPAVVDVAEEFFGFDPGATEVVIADGRQYLAATDRSFDYVVLDAFAGEVIPAHLLSSEMIELVRRRLRPDGVLLVNFGGYRKGEEALPLRSLVKTIRQWLPWVEVRATIRGAAFGSNLLVASRKPRALVEGPLPFDVPPRVDPYLDMGRPLDLDGPAVVVTDDYNPLELWALAGHETWRKGLLEAVPPAILLAE